MPIISQQNLLIPYPQKVALSVQFDYAIVDIHNSFDYLEELWEDIVTTISNAITDSGITILEGTTDINDNYTIIAYNLVILAVPPYIDFTFIYNDLYDVDLPSSFLISTPNYYNKEIKDILLQTK
ncbi:hypothetical protein MODO_3482 [Myroides odoratimimus]|uniref:Uncharacterized protein n=2 Tax=Myroides odoratimimus TaxID=76832 RepID=A0ABN0EEW8_9FLAO|nr:MULTISPECIES: hypothetical protein [Myroides]EHO12903.1 hypothetical protein HMPREF9712_00050 [Myroides odoratimimus CCUG 10230]EHO13674.1 hypothetical protein HMPREF9715_01212 [Myroides odoratimimus CIP 101113]EKB03473.1 hypothetical protein HMPREF9711_02800 [Myroides odoratimimus CCUG 3837]MDM1519301.1 hypothetical protein [Myroides odoratimimus]MDM1526480.1 hypothetical protein [Myroides odoratimimus]